MVSLGAALVGRDWELCKLPNYDLRTVAKESTVLRSITLWNPEPKEQMEQLDFLRFKTRSERTPRFRFSIAHLKSIVT